MHHKWQHEFIGGCARYQRGNAFKIEIAGRQRSLSADGETDRRADDAHVVDRDHALLEKLHRDGQTIVMVTHDRTLAHQADRVLVLKNGKLVSEKDE